MIVDKTANSILDTDVLVIGAGFAGLHLLHELRGKGFSVRVVEAAPEVGGTWFWNRYPGARCDVESVEYSYSWDPELDQEWEWTEKYPAQGDILRYLQHVADRHDLRKDIDFNTRITAATWDADSTTWTAEAEDGRRYRAQFLLMAVGSLSAPKDVDLPGIELFEGEVLRTYDWPERANLGGRRAAIVGTGSTGAQVVPALADEVADLLVLQRTPNFVIPTRNRSFQPGELEELKAEYEQRRLRNRSHPAGVSVVGNPKKTYEVDDDEREATFQERWEGGGIGFLSAFADLMLDEAANDAVCEFVRTKIAETVDDPATAEALQPTTYPLGAKRPVVATDYYEAFNKDNVSLLDLRRNPLESFTATGIKLADGSTHDFDTLVLATGFDAFTGAFTRMSITGENGRDLTKEWQTAGPRNFLGLSSEGFPNLMIVANAGSPSVLVNVVAAIEQHVWWITDFLQHMRNSDLRTAVAAPDAQASWGETVETVASVMLSPKDAGSWYRGANVEGKPQAFMPYAGGLLAYGDRLKGCAEDGYRGFVLA